MLKNRTLPMTKKAERDIRCPKCSARPRPEDRWVCVPSCGTVFHTFWTGGVCPGCSYRWTKTQCLACGELSPHAHWYREPDDAPAEQRERVISAS
jgi:C4-type Zn-finger protein